MDKVLHRNNEIKQLAISQMAAGYSHENYNNDKKLVKELREREKDLDEAEIDTYNLAFTRLSLFEAQGASLLRKEKEIIDAKKMESERKAEDKKRREKMLRELSSWEARDRILLFLKLRKNKTLSDRHINDFSNLLNNVLYRNFKSFDDVAISNSQHNDYEIRLKAIKCLKSDFIKLESGGCYRKTDITDFSLYKDGKYRATISGVKGEITKNDFYLLTYVFS